MKKEWVTSIRDQCRKAGVPFFFKQWGGVQKSRAGRELDGHTYDEFPLVPFSPMLEKQARLAAVEQLEAGFLGGNVEQRRSSKQQ
jgi:hypothetical protein